jgi:hypothetical protein
MAGQRREGGLYEHRSRCTKPCQQRDLTAVSLFKRAVRDVKQWMLSAENVDGDRERVSAKGR